MAYVHREAPNSALVARAVALVPLGSRSYTVGTVLLYRSKKIWSFELDSKMCNLGEVWLSAGEVPLGSGMLLCLARGQTSFIIGSYRAGNLMRRFERTTCCLGTGLLFQRALNQMASWRFKILCERKVPLPGEVWLASGKGCTRLWCAGASCARADIVYKRIMSNGKFDEKVSKKYVLPQDRTFVSKGFESNGPLKVQSIN